MHEHISPQCGCGRTCITAQFGLGKPVWWCEDCEDVWDVQESSMTEPPDFLDWRSTAEKKGGMAAAASYLHRLRGMKFIGEIDDLEDEVRMNPALGSLPRAIVIRSVRKRRLERIKKGARV